MTEGYMKESERSRECWKRAGVQGERVRDANRPEHGVLSATHVSTGRQPAHAKCLICASVCIGRRFVCVRACVRVCVRARVRNIHAQT